MKKLTINELNDILANIDSVLFGNETLKRFSKTLNKLLNTINTNLGHDDIAIKIDNFICDTKSDIIQSIYNVEDELIDKIINL